MIPLSVRAVGMVCSVGYTAAECHASVRAGIARIGETSVMSREGSPIRMGLVPPEGVHALPLVDAAQRTTRHRRTLRLAHAAVAEAVDAVGARALPLLAVTGVPDAHGAVLLDDLAVLLGDRVDRAASWHFAGGAPAVFLALHEAAGRIERGEAQAVVVVGADSPMDLVRLDALQHQERLLVDDVMDGFIPGEGAAALVVTAAMAGSLATVCGLGVEEDPFRLDGDETLTADGLTRAVHAALAGATSPVRHVWAGLNGESWSAKEWGIAARRAHRALAPDARTHHPAECFGDTGAALGAMLLALAAMGRRGPSLVWSLSEGGLRGAARLEAP